MLLLRRPPLRRARTAAVTMGRRAFANHSMDAFMEFEREMALKKRSENPPLRRERKAPLTPPEKPKDDECCKLDCPNCVLLVYQEKLLEYELSRLDRADARVQPKPSKPEPTRLVRFIEPADVSSRQRALLRENDLAIFSIAANALVSAPHHTKDDWWRSVRHIDLHVSEHQKALVGDDASNIAVFVPNDAAVVNRMLAHLHADPDVVFTAEPLASTADSEGEGDTGRPPLVSQPFATIGSVREALTWSFDLVAPPRPGFLKSLAAFASDDRDIDALTMPNALEAFADHPSQSLTIPDIFDRFPSLRLSFTDFFHLAPPNAPRYYTVSSSRRFFPDRVSLTLGLKQRASQPVPRCSSHLAALLPGRDTVRAAFFRSSFVFPRTDRRPIVLVSAGTGIAPFRAFLQDLQHEREEEELEDASSHRKAYLFYGCRSPAVDFLYSDELQDALAAGVLDRLDVAFSSNGHEPKRYVQDALAEQSALVVEHLVRERGHVFVCGSLAMGRAVKRTIAAALQEHATVSGVKSEREAKALVTQWLESGQIVTELW